MSVHPATQKPVVGLNLEFKPSYNGVPELTYLFAGYYKSIERAGGIPLLLPPLEDKEDIAQALSLVDACVLVGGPDLDPRNDGYMLHPFVRLMSEEREKYDRALMDEIARIRMPVMGVGVGMQLLNVSQGGSLFLHIPEDIPNAMPHRDMTSSCLRHSLTIVKGTLLDQVYGDNDVRVNSCHHMAVDDLAPGFRVSARCTGDNLVEAIESTYEDWLAFGVQFHPEAPSATFLDQRIFSLFVKGVKEYKATGRNCFANLPSPSETKDQRRRKSERSSLAKQGASETFLI